MPRTAAKKSFAQGLSALAAENPLRAADFFLEAMQTEERLGVRRPDMRYLSYYGLSLARAYRAAHAAIEACQLAVRHDPSNPILLLNLGQVQLLSGRRDAALASFRRGLKIAPGDHALREALDLAERRSSPTLRFLDRSNFLNRWIGRLHGLRRVRPA